MKLLRKSPPARQADLSIVLADWSCRESFHILDGLARQSWPRDRYEVIWVEFYSARPADLERRGEAVDVHALLEIDPDVCVHKHLIYNAGIVLASGRIVCICDSDAVVSPDFVGSIERAFDESPGRIVLHLDEVRNDSRRFYPFDDPTPEQITGPGCLNWINGRPAGLVDERDVLHSRNYGACMAARREDLIAIGGADEHLDYAGHICGPYEMTFRLVNAGLREVWHESEWLYHLWHPGRDGVGERFGASDGRGMSATALAARDSGRTEPLAPSAAIQMLRTAAGPVDEDALLAAMIDPSRIEQWRRGRIRSVPPTPSGRQGPPGPRLRFRTKVHLAAAVAGMLAEQVRLKGTANLRTRKPTVGVARRSVLGAFTKFRNLFRFTRGMAEYDRHVCRQCWRTLKTLAGRGEDRILLYGLGRVGNILALLSADAGVRIAAAAGWDGYTAGADGGIRLLDEAALAGRAEPIVVAATVNVADKVSRLLVCGVQRGRVWVLQ